MHEGDLCGREKYLKSVNFLNESLFMHIKKPIYCLIHYPLIDVQTVAFFYENLLIEKYSLKIHFDIGFAIVFHLLFK